MFRFFNHIVKKYMARAKAFVYAACEDFGIALVEAQACGTPVIALGVGGALETVRDIRTHSDTGTGILFKIQTVGALLDAVEKFVDYQHLYNYEYIQIHANQFSHQIFAKRYLDFVNQCREKRVYQQ